MSFTTYILESGDHKLIGIKNPEEHLVICSVDNIKSIKLTKEEALEVYDIIGKWFK